MSDKSVEVFRKKKSKGERFVDAVGGYGLPSAGLTALMNLPAGIKPAAKVSAGVLPIATAAGYFLGPKEKLVRKKD